MYNKIGKKSEVERLYEEFPFWMNGKEIDDRLKFPVSYQTRGFYDTYKIQHKAKYSSFDEFIEAALMEDMKDKKY